MTWVPPTFVDKEDGGTQTLDAATLNGMVGAISTALAAGSSSATGMLLPSGKFVEVIPSINTGFSLTLNREYVFGLQLAAQTLDRIALLVSGAGSTGAVIRIGVRQDNDGTPGASVAEGTVSATAIGAQALTLSRIHPGGTLWLSITGQGWSTTAPSVDGRGAANAGPWTAPLVSGAFRTAIDWANGHTPLVGYQDGVSGALGSTFTNAATTSQNIPTLVLRRA